MSSSLAHKKLTRGFTLIEIMIALLIGYESFNRLLNPVPIAFDEAIAIAAVGFGINLASALLLHGSADMIGGQAIAIKTKFGLGRDQLLFPGAPQSIKFASGENPKRVYGEKGGPSTRMGNVAGYRQAFADAKDSAAHSQISILTSSRDSAFAIHVTALRACVPCPIARYPSTTITS